MPKNPKDLVPDATYPAKRYRLNGHPVFRYVERTAKADLIKTADEFPNNPAVSSFYNASIEKFVVDTMKNAKRTEIEKWLATASVGSKQFCVSVIHVYSTTKKNTKIFS